MVKLVNCFFVTVECWTPTSRLLSCGDLYAEAADDFECAIDHDVFERNDEENILLFSELHRKAQTH